MEIESVDGPASVNAYGSVVIFRSGIQAVDCVSEKDGRGVVTDGCELSEISHRGSGSPFEASQRLQTVGIDAGLQDRSGGACQYGCQGTYLRHKRRGGMLPADAAEKHARVERAAGRVLGDKAAAFVEM